MTDSRTQVVPSNHPKSVSNCPPPHRSPNFYWSQFESVHPSQTADPSGTQTPNFFPLEHFISHSAARPTPNGTTTLTASVHRQQIDGTSAPTAALVQHPPLTATVPTASAPASAAPTPATVPQTVSAIVRGWPVWATRTAWPRCGTCSQSPFSPSKD